jgi:hypothetical protein
LVSKAHLLNITFKGFLEEKKIKKIVLIDRERQIGVHFQELTEENPSSTAGQYNNTHTTAKHTIKQQS